jgi:hypothetical protein
LFVRFPVRREDAPGIMVDIRSLTLFLIKSARFTRTARQIHA